MSNLEARAHKHHKRDDAKDIAASQHAWELWKSSDPRDWDKALDERERINKANPKAWKKAMHDIDEQEEAEKKRRPQDQSQVRHDEPKVKHDQSKVKHSELPPLQIEAKNVIIPHPGYAPESKFAPNPPASPAFDRAYNQPKPEFYGLDLGVLRAGVNSNGSLDLGVNIGIAKTDLQVGLENRVDAEFMPIGGPLHARAGAGIGVNRDGFHSEVGAGANFFNVVNGDADFGAKLGRDTGVDGDVRGKVFPVEVQADAGAGIGPDGVDAYTGANVDVLDKAGVRSGAHFSINDQNSSAGAGVGLQAGEDVLDFGPAIYSDGNSTIRPNLHLDSGNVEDRTFYPTGDRIRDRLD
ncbi:MAG: hypothetical protein K2Y32_15490 [Candidatus Obscuribacterales bacterium]|nr:hypothetical protein [Candidatus Obscuribacterales bacterium]